MPGNPRMTTYQGIFMDIRRQFRGAGLPGADLEARELVCFAAGKSRAEFYRDGGLYMSPETEAAVRGGLPDRRVGVLRVDAGD